MRKNYFFLVLLVCSFVTNSLSAQLTWKGTPPDPSLTTTGLWDLKTKSWTANGVDSTLWVNGSAAIFNKAVTSLRVDEPITCTSITANENITLAANTLAPTATINGVSAACDITVAAGKYFNIAGVPVVAATTYTKKGAGELVSTTSATGVAGTWNLNEGLFTIRGSLAGATININGNVILAAAGTRALNPTKLNVNSDFSIGLDSDSPSLMGLVNGGLNFNLVSNIGTAVDLGGVMRKITIKGTNTGNAFTGIVSNGGLILNGSSTNVLKLAGVNTYTMGTVINGGTLEMRTNNALPATGKITLNGGAINAVNYTQNCGALVLTDHSTLILNGASVNLNFANSSAEAWTAGKTLTVTGWSGIPGETGTGITGKFKVGVGGLTTEQLAQINFAGTGYTGAVLTAAGEVVPAASGSVPPVLVPENNLTKVTNTTFDITFVVDNVDWRANITKVTLDGETLAINAYDATQPSKITITTANCGTALQSTATKKFFVFYATGYLNAIYSKGLKPGDPTHLAVTLQPVSPTINGGGIGGVKVALKDMYENTCNIATMTNTIVATPTQSTWTLGGTTSVNAVNGEATFTTLTATSAISIPDASITFTTTIVSVPATVATFAFPISFLSDVSDVENSASIKIYANANKQITVVTENNQNGTIAVYNALGQKLTSEKINGNQTIISKSFKSGIYIISLNAGGRIISKKISVN